MTRDYYLTHFKFLNFQAEPQAQEKCARMYQQLYLNSPPDSRISIILEKRGDRFWGVGVVAPRAGFFVTYTQSKSFLTTLLNIETDLKKQMNNRLKLENKFHKAV